MMVLFHDASQQRKSRRRIDALSQRLRLAVAETNHRVKNHLQAVAALIDLYRDEEAGGLSPSETQKLSLHIRTLAQIHDFLHRVSPIDGPDTEFASIPAMATIGKLIGMVQATAPIRQISFTGNEIHIPGEQCSSLALIANELMSNALKHGVGDIEVELSHDAGTVSLAVSDCGPGFPEGFDRQTDFHTGLSLIESTVLTDLSGELQYVNLPEGGARVTVRFPRATSYGA